MTLIPLGRRTARLLQRNGAMTPASNDPPPAPRADGPSLAEKVAAAYAAGGTQIALPLTPPAPNPTPTPASSAKPPEPAAPEPGKQGKDDTFPPIPESVDPVLVRILSWKRAFDTRGEIEFMSWLHNEIKDRGAEFEIKARGCVAVQIKHPDGKASSTLFSCHTDTVHSGTGTTPQKIVYDPNFGEIFLDKDDADAGSCLGADDGAGVWVMLEMIKAKVPGTYLFHRGEERGCIGSNAMLTQNREWLEQFDCAIAFDRGHDWEVITHQGGQRTASDKFGEALALALNENGVAFEYRPSARGVLTDTKTYRYVIAECTNLGVGYQNQHGKDESLDYGHLVRLRDACLKVQWEALPIDRDPKAAPASTWEHGYGGGGYGGWGDFDDVGHGGARRYRWPNGSPSPAPAPVTQHGSTSKKHGKGGKGKGASLPPSVEKTFHNEDEVRDMSFDEVLAWCEENPDQAAALLIDMGADIAALKEKIAFLKGALK
jgi:hypothetical protein